MAVLVDMDGGAGGMKEENNDEVGKDEGVREESDCYYVDFI